MRWLPALVLACAPAAPPSHPQAAQTLQSILAPGQLATRTDTLLVRDGADSVGIVVVVYVADSTTLIDSIKAPGQNAVVVLDTRSRTNTTVSDSIKGEVVHLVYEANVVRGLRVTVDSGGRLDSMHIVYQVPPGTFDRRSLILLLQLVPLREDAFLSFPAFDSWSQQIQMVGIAVGGYSWVRLRSGTMSAYRVDVRGKLPTLPRVFYMSTTVPRRVLLMRQGSRTWELVNRRLH